MISYLIPFSIAIFLKLFLGHSYYILPSYLNFRTFYYGSITEVLGNFQRRNIGAGNGLFWLSNSVEFCIFFGEMYSLVSNSCLPKFDSLYSIVYSSDYNDDSNEGMISSSPSQEVGVSYKN